MEREDDELAVDLDWPVDDMRAPWPRTRRLHRPTEASGSAAQQLDLVREERQLEAARLSQTGSPAERQLRIELEQLQSLREELKAEAGRLAQTASVAAKALREQLQVVREELRVEREQLLAERDQLQREVAGLASRRRATDKRHRAEREQLETQREQLERDAAKLADDRRAVYECVRFELDQLQAERDEQLRAVETGGSWRQRSRASREMNEGGERSDERLRPFRAQQPEGAAAPPAPGDDRAPAKASRRPSRQPASTRNEQRTAVAKRKTQRRLA